MASPVLKSKEVSLPASFKLYGGSAAKVADVRLQNGIESKQLEAASKPAIVSHQTKPAPLPPKQPKYIVNRVSSRALNDDLKKIVSCVSRGQRTNIDELTKGHLNETHLLPAIPVHLGDPKERRWGGYEEDLPKPKAPKTKPRKKPSTRNAEYSNMQFALQEFVMRTSGLNDMLSTVFTNGVAPSSEEIPEKTLDKIIEDEESPGIEDESLQHGVSELITESIEELEIYDADSTMRGSYKPNPGNDPLGPKWNQHPQVEEIRPGELKLPKLKKIKKPSETPSIPDTPGSTKFFTSHLYAATKKDQFSGWLGFQQKVLNVSDAKEVQLVSNNLAAKYYKQKLSKLLTSLPSRVYRSSSPCLEKVRAHGKIWDDLVKDSPIFGPVLAAIKFEYENYMNYLSEHERLKMQSGSLENEVTGLLTGGAGHLFGTMALGDDGVPVFDSDVVAEEEFRNMELEAEYQFLLENNQKAYEQIKSEKRKLEARKQALRERLLETVDSKSSSDNMSQSDLILGLRDEILDTIERIDEVNSQIKHNMVPVCLTESIRSLTEQDEKSVKNYSEMCERVIELCTETGKEMNDQLSKAVINPFEVKMIWRKLKTMTSVCKYTLASYSSKREDIPLVMTSEGTSSDTVTSNKTIEDTINISQQDVEAVLAEEEQELFQNMEQNRPESSRREDFDFYF